MQKEKKTGNNGFRMSQRNKILHEVQIDKCECGKIAATYNFKI